MQHIDVLLCLIIKDANKSSCMTFLADLNCLVVEEYLMRAVHLKVHLNNYNKDNFLRL